MMEPKPSGKRRVSRKLLWITIVLTVIAWAPAAGVWWAESFAARHGCALHEGFANPCVVNGHDYGETLYSWFVMGWLILLTLPLMLITPILWLVVAVKALRKPR